MPKMDGITFVKEVKKTASRYVPILVLTTESQMDKKAEGKAAGATGWLVKPFEPAQLLELVKKFVR
jgi:two-component system chemotaxis response regulator CheY